MRLPVAAVLMFLGAIPAQADLARCQLLLELGQEPLGLRSKGSVSALENGCHYQDVEAELIGFSQSFRAEGVTITGEGLDQFISEERIPTALDVTIENLVMIPRTPDNLLNWVFAQQFDRRKIQARLSYTWDEPTNTLTIAEARADFYTSGSIRADGIFEGIDLSSVEALTKSARRLSVRQVSLDFENVSLFEELFLIPLAFQFLGVYDDPEVGVAVLQDKAVEGLRSFPETILDPASREALEHLVADMPRPTGHLSLGLRAEPPLGPQRLAGIRLSEAAAMPSMMWGAMQGVQIEAEWLRKK